MNTTTMNKTPGAARHLKLLSGVLMAGLLLAATGCSTTKEVSINLEKEQSGFLGDNYSLLRKGDAKEINYYYLAPSVDWKKYTKIWIKPIEVWPAEDGKSALSRYSKDEQQLLLDYLTSALIDTLSKNFEMVDHGGPDVLVIHGAITNARKAKPVINLVTTLYPAALVLSYGKQVVTGSATGVGVSVVEFEILDGDTGKLLVAGMDSRAGTKALRTKFDGTWGDYRLACDWWSRRLGLRLALFKQGDFTEDKL